MVLYNFWVLIHLVYTVNFKTWQWVLVPVQYTTCMTFIASQEKYQWLSSLPLWGFLSSQV